MKEQIEKQAIAEMASVMMEHYEIDNQCGNCHWSTCDECLAEVLYKADYRKQRVGEWIWTEKGEADCEKYWVCSACKEHDFVKTKYCPNCGAHMKGGAE